MAIAMAKTVVIFSFHYSVIVRGLEKNLENRQFHVLGVATDVDGAMKRARNVAAPINNQRFNGNNPCVKTGACADCKSPDTICCSFLVTRFSRVPDRMHILLVNDDLGF